MRTAFNRLDTAGALLAAGAMLAAMSLATPVKAQTLMTIFAPPAEASTSYAPVYEEQPGVVEDENAEIADPRFKRTIVDYATKEAAGTVVIDTPNTYLYYVLGNGKAVRYGIGVGREGFTWSGVKSVERKAEWPDWHPPTEMIARQPYLPRFTAGGPGNPLGARAMYIGGTVYRIHGTNAPSTIGKQVSSGCIRLTNDDVMDLYERVKIGAKVVVLPMTGRQQAKAAPAAAPASITATAYAPEARSQAADAWATIRRSGIY